MLKQKILIALCLIKILILPAWSQNLLKVSNNKRFIVKSDNTPFFYLGDTAWELFHRLDREKADMYLKNRAKKGFTVIQAVILAELDGLHTPNPYGHTPLINDDPTKPNEAYFEHVDYVVNKAEELGLYIGMLPTWGGKVFKDSWGVGPEIFNVENARTYGEFLGKRYRDKPIIWIIGGDRNPRENSNDAGIWDAMAQGIVNGVGGNDKAFITFHPQPLEEGSSSKWFHNKAWLDFNMHQTGHCREARVYELIRQDYELNPEKPTLNGEPIYEDHPVCFNAQENGYSYPSDIRRAAYFSFFAGAAGHTYGCHNIWQMWEPGKTPINGPLKPWYESLELPGAVQMSYVRKLMESRPVESRVPDQSLIATTNISDTTNVKVLRGKNYAFVYTASGKPFSLYLGKISGSKLRTSWFDPRKGEFLKGDEIENKGTKTFRPPSQGVDQDWVLILDAK